MKYLSAILLGFIAISACNTTMADTDSPVINIFSPATSTGGEYFTDSTIKMDARITDNDELHEVNLSIIRSYDHGAILDGEVFHRHYHPDANELVIDEAYVIDTAYHSNFWIYFEANDHNMNTTKDSVLIHVHM